MVVVERIMKSDEMVANHIGQRRVAVLQPSSATNMIATKLLCVALDFHFHSYSLGG
jgi:hypothetical protein